uniref:Uncharacterized protein n=1 Tax=Romanomermis culicivorax TaxID=13658 RepID=A0A915JDR7_ROMCU
MDICAVGSSFCGCSSPKEQKWAPVSDFPSEPRQAQVRFGSGKADHFGASYCSLDLVHMQPHNLARHLPLDLSRHLVQQWRLFSLRTHHLAQDLPLDLAGILPQNNLVSSSSVVTATTTQETNV